MGCCPGRNTTPTSPSCTTNCFRAVDVTRGCVDSSPAPCGGTLTIDLAEENNNLNNCTSGGVDCPVVYQLISHTSHFSSVTISSAGELELTVSDSATPSDLGTIRYRVYCTCNSYSSTGKVRVCIKNLCTNVLCEEGDYCNKCTGECDPIIPNATLT